MAFTDRCVGVGVGALDVVGTGLQSPRGGTRPHGRVAGLCAGG